MAAPRSRANRALIDGLLAEPHRFDFFQAVRVLEWLTARDQPSAVDTGHSPDEQRRRQSVGGDANPRAESVRFRTALSLAFPSCPVAAVQPLADPGNGASNGDLPQHEMTVNFMGLAGSGGVLPLHYTRLLIERTRDKDISLRDFFDLFNHRLISLFYRAWEKYRFPSGYQRAQREGGDERVDLFTYCLYSLIGMSTDGLRGRVIVGDQALLLYAGYFANRHRNAISFERMVADYFDVPAHVEQFQGQWLRLEPGDRSRLPDAELPAGLNNCLGQTTVLGSSVWDVQSRFRVRLGPLTYERFFDFTPAGRGLPAVCELARLYAGSEFDFDVQPVLLKNEAPPCQLGAAEEPRPRLGWNTFLKTRELEEDFTGAAFACAS